MPADFDRGGSSQTQPQGNAWLAPAVVLSFAPAGYRDISLTIGNTYQILGNNPSRVGFIVVRGTSLTTFPAIGPFPDPSRFSLPADPNVSVRTFVLTDWLSLIIGEWYVIAGETGTIRVVEFQPSF